MKLELICVSGKNPSWVTEGFEHYQRRMPQGYTLSLREVPAAPRGARYHVGTAQKKEMLALPDLQRSLKVVLDRSGKVFSSAKLADKLSGWRQHGSSAAFLIGGPDGWHEQVVHSADIVWSLSQLTFAHGLARVMVAEQLYRAASICVGGAYHR